MTLTPKQNELITIFASIVSRMMAEESDSDKTDLLVVDETSN